jgi:hypothetical protein
MDPYHEKNTTRFLHDTPAGLSSFLLHEPYSPGSGSIGQRFIVTGECQDLRAVGFICSGRQKLSDLPSRTRKILFPLYVRSGSEIRVETGTITEKMTNRYGTSTLVINDPSGHAVNLSQIKKIAHRTLATPPEIHSLEDAGFGNSTSTAQQAQWIVLFGIGTVLFLGIALGVTAATRFRDQADDLGSVSILTGRRAPFWGIGGWTVAGPMVLGTWAALAVSWILIAPLLGIPDSPKLSAALLILAPTLLTVIALLTWVYISVSTIRHLQDWKPRNT